MSKQQLIDELHDLKRQLVPANTENRTWNLAISHCIGSVNTALAGMEISPEEPSYKMISAARKALGEWSGSKEERDKGNEYATQVMYKAMLQAAKEQS